MARSAEAIERRRVAARDRARQLRSTPAGRDRVNARKREWYAANRERISEEWASRSTEAQRDAYLRSHYGITAEDYDRMLALQGGVCAACAGADPQAAAHCGPYFHVDHDHSTDAIRGLLCGGCNRALGQIGDSVDRLFALAAYLLQSQDVLARPTMEV